MTTKQYLLFKLTRWLFFFIGWGPVIAKLAEGCVPQPWYCVIFYLWWGLALTFVGNFVEADLCEAAEAEARRRMWENLMEGVDRKR